VEVIVRICDVVVIVRGVWSGVEMTVRDVWYRGDGEGCMM
jgi:hypothetical protein